MSYRKYLTDKKSRHLVNIDDTELEPTYQMGHGGKFKERYTKHLESLIYHDREMRMGEFLTLLVFVELINEKKTPICIQCNKRPRMVRDVISVIGEFLDNNYTVLNRLLEMYIGKVRPEDIEEEED